MVIPDFLRKRGQLLGICLVVIQIQYAVSQIDAFTTSAVQQPNGFTNFPTGSPAFTNFGPEMSPALPQSPAADFQSMLSMLNQPSTTNVGSTQMQPGMEEMMMKMTMQSFGQSPSPTPEQLGFTHYGPTTPAAKPLTPEQTMMNMLMQQSQGEQSNNNMMLQYLLLMNAMKPTTSSAASSAASMTPTAAPTIPVATPAAASIPVATAAPIVLDASTSAPIPLVGTSTQATPLTKILPINVSPNSFKSNLIRTNNSDFSVSFSGMSGKLGLPTNQSANQNSILLKRLLLNRLLANNKLRLMRIRFFNKKNKETVITAANASTVAKPQLKTGPLNSTTKLDPKPATAGISTGSNPQASTISPIVPVGTPRAVNSVTQSSAIIGQHKLPLRAQTIGRANQVTTQSRIPVRKHMPRAQRTFEPIQHPVLSVTTQRPMILTTPPSWRSMGPSQQNSAPAAKSWRYPSYPHGHHQQQHQNSVNYQNQMPFQYQNPSPMQYQPVNQAPMQNYQQFQYNSQASPAAPSYQSNQGQYQSVAYPNQNVAYPSNSAVTPNQNVAYPSSQVFNPNQNVAYPSNSAVNPNQNVAYPSNNVVNPNQNVAYPSNNVVQTNQNVANPNYAYQQLLGHNGYPMPFPGRSAFPMPSDPRPAQVNPPADPVLPVSPANMHPAIDSAEARAEYLEQNPPTEQPPPTTTTPAPSTTTWSMPLANPKPNPLLNPKSNKQWAEVLHFLSKNFPDYMSLRSQVHQTALSSPMANQFRNAMAAKSNTAMGHANHGSHWMFTTPSTTPAGEPLEVEPLEVEPTQPGTTTTSPMHPFHAANAAAALGYEIAKSANGHIFGGNFGPTIQQRQSNAKRDFDMFGMMSGHNGAQSNGFHGPAHNSRHGNQHVPFFTNGHKKQNSQWGMNGAV